MAISPWGVLLEMWLGDHSSMCKFDNVIHVNNESRLLGDHQLFNLSVVVISSARVLNIKVTD